MRNCLMVPMVLIVLLSAATAGASTTCQDLLNCGPPPYFDDPQDCYAQCKVNACREAVQVDQSYEWKYNFCWNQYRNCTPYYPPDVCMDYVQQTCFEPTRRDHDSDCNRIQNSEGLCVAACWECQHC